MSFLDYPIQLCGDCIWLLLHILFSIGRHSSFLLDSNMIAPPLQHGCLLLIHCLPFSLLGFQLQDRIVSTCIHLVVCMGLYACNDVFVWGIYINGILYASLDNMFVWGLSVRVAGVCVFHLVKCFYEIVSVRVVCLYAFMKLGIKCLCEFIYSWLHICVDIWYLGLHICADLYHLWYIHHFNHM